MIISWQSGLVLTPLEKGYAVRINPDSHCALSMQGTEQRNPEGTPLEQSQNNQKLTQM